MSLLWSWWGSRSRKRQMLKLESYCEICAVCSKTTTSEKLRTSNGDQCQWLVPAANLHDLKGLEISWVMGVATRGICLNHIWGTSYSPPKDRTHIIDVTGHFLSSNRSIITTRSGHCVNKVSQKCYSSSALISSCNQWLLMAITNVHQRWVLSK